MFTFRNCLRSTTCTHCLCTTPNPNDRNTEIVSSTNKWLNCIFSNKLNYNVSLKNINWRQYDLKIISGHMKWFQPAFEKGPLTTFASEPLWSSIDFNWLQCTSIAFNLPECTSFLWALRQLSSVHWSWPRLLFRSVEWLELSCITLLYLQWPPKTQIYQPR